MYSCVYPRVCVCMHACVYACMCVCIRVCGVAEREGGSVLKERWEMATKKKEFGTTGGRPTEKLPHGGYLRFFFIKFYSEHATLYWLFHKWRGFGQLRNFLMVCI